MAVCGLGWRPITRAKYADDFERFVDWLDHTERPATTAAFDLPTVAAYVAFLRERPRVTTGWRGVPGTVERAIARGDGPTLSANTVNSYVRPLRSLVIWLVDEGYLPTDPFRQVTPAGDTRPLSCRSRRPRRRARRSTTSGRSSAAAPETRRSTCATGRSLRSS